MYTRSTRRASFLPVLAGLCMSMDTALTNRHVKAISPIFSSLKGKLGGAVANTSRFGITLRSLVIPGNPQTVYQHAVRNILATLASYWDSTLTITQRATWTNLSEDTPGSSGGNTLFTKANSERVRGGGAIVTTAPDTMNGLFSQLPTAIAVTADDSDPVDHTLNFTLPADAALVDLWAIHDGGLMNVYVSAPQKATRLTRIKPFTYVDTLLGDTTVGDRPGGVQVIDLDATDLNEKFAAADPGDVCYVKFTTVDYQGRRSQDYVTRVTVTAA